MRNKIEKSFVWLVSLPIIIVVIIMWVVVFPIVIESIVEGAGKDSMPYVIAWFAQDGQRLWGIYIGIMVFSVPAYSFLSASLPWLVSRVGAVGFGLTLSLMPVIFIFLGASGLILPAPEIALPPTETPTVQAGFTPTPQFGDGCINSDLWNKTESSKGNIPEGTSCWNLAAAGISVQEDGFQMASTGIPSSIAEYIGVYTKVSDTGVIKFKVRINEFSAVDNNYSRLLLGMAAESEDFETSGAFVLFRVGPSDLGVSAYLASKFDDEEREADFEIQYGQSYEVEIEIRTTEAVVTLTDPSTNEMSQRTFSIDPDSVFYIVYRVLDEGYISVLISDIELID